jgi:hypothetical protein
MNMEEMDPLTTETETSLPAPASAEAPVDVYSVPAETPGAVTAPPVATPVKVNTAKALVACVAGAMFPGLGHAALRKWDRVAVFSISICAMFALGLHLNGSLFDPSFSDLFPTLKFIADAGSGSLYWICWLRGLGTGDPAAYTYDFGNVFIYTAGLLNMLVIVDAFDIALGRKP